MKNLLILKAAYFKRPSEIIFKNVVKIVIVITEDLINFLMYHQKVQWCSLWRI